jgi:hypothetical protein
MGSLFSRFLILETEMRKLWHAEKGVYDVMVGSSSEQIELTGKITLRHRPQRNNNRIICPGDVAES